jgi:adenylosuccinate lyase
MSKEWADIPMLAKTHGQPASPTRVGKEIEVFVARIREQLGRNRQNKGKCKQSSRCL